MPRIVVPSPRLVVPAPRQRVLDARCSLWFDGVDDQVAGTIPAAITGAAPWTICCRYFPTKPAGTTAGCLFIGTLAPHQWAMIGQRAVFGGLYRVGGGVSTAECLSDAVVQPRWYDVAFRFSGGAGGTLSLHVDNQSVKTAAWAVPALTGTTACIGRNLGGAACPGNVCDARVYAADIGAAGVAAWRRGEEPATPARWWKLEDGLGTTAHEEIGGTDDPVTGALPSPLVPFRRSRIVEDVPAAALGTGAVSCTVAHHADLDPAAGSFSLSLWTSARGVSGDIIASKDDGSKGWILDFTTGGALRLRLRDGATTITVTGTAILGSLWSGVGSWRTVTITCDRVGGFAYLSVDGGPPARTALGALGSIANTADLIFGAGASGFVGGLNDSWWWNGRALSWDERRALYFDGIVPAASGATRIGWAMRENTGTVVASSPSGYNGTLSADSHTTATRCKARIAVP